MKDLEEKINILSDYENLNMPDYEKQMYFKVKILYLKLLNDYLSLNQYDDKLTNSQLRFIKTPKNQQDIYQFLSPNNYYFIRNNLHIDRLPIEDFKYLSLKQDDVLDEKSEELIKRTFQTVIKEVDEKISGPFMAVYGPLASDAFQAKNDSLVIGFRYDEFNTDGLSDEEWEELNEKQYAFLTKQNQEMMTELSEKYHIPVKVIEYDEYSVQPLEYEKKNKQM